MGNENLGDRTPRIKVTMSNNCASRTQKEIKREIKKSLAFLLYFTISQFHNIGNALISHLYFVIVVTVPVQ